MSRSPFRGGAGAGLLVAGLGRLLLPGEVAGKVGGYPGWTQPPNWPDCAGCGTRMEHLLSVTATEPCMGRWLPLDDRDPRQDGATVPSWRAEADPAVLDGFGHDMILGDLGGMYFFVCRSCPDTPYTHRFDC